MADGFLLRMMDASWVRRAVLTGGAIGALLFGAALIASFVDPLLVERVGREIIRMQVQKKVNQRIDALDEAFLVKQAARLHREYAARIEGAKRMLREKVPERTAAWIAQMQSKDCECRRKIEAKLSNLLEESIAGAQQAMHGLDELIRAQYLTVAGRITREFRIFTGVNAAICAALAVAAWLRPRAGVRLMPAALVLLASGVLTAYLYLFAQNWLETLIFGTYMGWAYVAYVGAFALWLSDIVFNRGRITGQVLSAVLDVAGQTAVILPC